MLSFYSHLITLAPELTPKLVISFLLCALGLAFGWFIGYTAYFIYAYIKSKDISKKKTF